MIKVNLSSGTTTIENIETQVPVGGIFIKKFQTKRLGLYNLYPSNSNKYFLLKIHNIQKPASDSTGKDINIEKWCVNGKLLEYFNDDIDNQNPDGTYFEKTGSTTEIFALHRKDLKKLQDEAKMPNGDKTFTLYATLYEKNKNYYVWFSIKKDPIDPLESGIILGPTIGSSGVKVPRGSA